MESRQRIEKYSFPHGDIMYMLKSLIELNFITKTLFIGSFKIADGNYGFGSNCENGNLTNYLIKILVIQKLQSGIVFN